MTLIKTYLKKIVDFLRKNRHWLGGSLLEYCIAVVIFTVIAVVATDFVILDAASRVFTAGPGDGTGGFMWYNFVQPGLSPFLSRSDMVNYPYGEAIGGPSFIAYLGLWMPMRILAFMFGPVVGANLFMLMAFVLSGVSMYWLIKRLTRNIPIAYFAGYATAFVPYSVYKSINHLPYILAYIFVFLLAGFIALWKKPTVLRAVLFGLAIALAFYTDGYYILLVPVLVVCQVVAGFIYSAVIRERPGEIWKKVKYLMISGGIALLALLPIAYAQFSNGAAIKQSLDGRRANFTTEMNTYRTQVIDFLLPADTNPLFSNDDDFQGMNFVKDLRSNYDENTNYIGYVIIILTVVGGTLSTIWLIRRRSSSLSTIEPEVRNKLIFVACITLVAVPVMVAFMMSPNIRVAGVTIPLPGQILIDANITLWRVMSRFFIPLHVVLVLFAALTLWVVLRVHFPQSKQGKKNKKNKIIPLLIVAVLSLVLILEYAAAPNRPTYGFDKASEGYYWLQKQNDIKVIAEFDVVDPLDARTARYVTAQMVHGKKIINFKEDTEARLTNTLGGFNNPETIRWMIDRGAQAVITHDNKKCKEVPWADVVHSAEDSYMNIDRDTSTNTLCIYRPHLPPVIDGQYVKFTSGFMNRPNIDDQSGTIFEKSRATFVVTDANFQVFKTPGKTRVKANINALAPNGKEKSWKIFQDNREIAKGSFVGMNTIDVVVDRTKPVTIEVRGEDGRPAQELQYALTGTEATKVQQ